MQGYVLTEEYTDKAESLSFW